MPLLKPLFGQAELQRDHPLAQGLVGAWLFHEGSGDRVWDYSGNGNHGVLTNMDPATDWVPTPSGYGVELDSGNDCVILPGSGTLSGLAACSIVAVCTPTISDGSAFVVCKYATSYEYALYISAATGTLSFFTEATGYTPAAMVNVKTGRHVLGCSAGPGRCTLHADGVAYAASSAPASLTTGTRTLAIGRQGGTAAFHFPGRIEYVAIWGVALADAVHAEIAADPFAMLRPRRRVWMLAPSGVTYPTWLKHNRRIGLIGVR